jgi:hypothetical protein
MDNEGLECAHPTIGKPRGQHDFAAFSRTTNDVEHIKRELLLQPVRGTVKIGEGTLKHRGLVHRFTHRLSREDATPGPQQSSSHV